METDSQRLEAIREQLAVLEAQRGTTEAFCRLVDAYERRLLYFIRRLLGETDGALDVLQETWLTVHRRLHTLESPQAFRTWVYRIARDKTIDVLRRNHREQSLLADFADERLCEEAAEESGSALEFDDVEEIHRGLTGLSPAHREVLTLRFLEEMPLQEIALVAGCSLGTVKSRLHHARRLLREKLERVSHD